MQYVVKHEQGIDCGGGYLKLFPSTVDQKKLHGGADEDVYNIMFGHDICGYDKKTVSRLAPRRAARHRAPTPIARCAARDLPLQRREQARQQEAQVRHMLHTPCAVPER